MGFSSVPDYNDYKITQIPSCNMHCITGSYAGKYLPAGLVKTDPEITGHEKLVYLKSIMVMISFHFNC